MGAVSLPWAFGDVWELSGGMDWEKAIAKGARAVGWGREGISQLKVKILSLKLLSLEAGCSYS